jgi:hypothetical protein
MRLAQHKSVLTVFGFFALCSVLAGCPEKGAPPDKTTAEPERAEPDDEGKAADTKDAKKPAAAAPAAPAEDKKPDEDKDKGGW